MHDIDYTRTFVHEGCRLWQRRPRVARVGVVPGEEADPGFRENGHRPQTSKGWKPVSDRKIRVGIVGYGVCQFGAAFSFQDHPNVEVVAVSDLFPDRCAGLAKACRCEKTYPSLEELVKDDKIEAVFVATDAPSHARHCIEVLKHGKHVASAVPAVFGSLEDADKLFEAVKTSGLKYMMFETSCFHDDLYAMRQIYKAGGFGKLVYSEGRILPLHGRADRLVQGLARRPAAAVVSDALERLLRGRDRRQLHRSLLHGHAQRDRASAAGEQPLQEPVRHRDRAVPHQRRRHVADGGQLGHARATAARWAGSAGRRVPSTASTRASRRSCPTTKRPPLPPGVDAGGHGGSHGYLMNEFVTAILADRKPLVDVAQALNMTVAGIVAHQSALKDGELMKIPQYKL